MKRYLNKYIKDSLEQDAQGNKVCVRLRLFESDEPSMLRQNEPLRLFIENQFWNL